MTLEIINLKKQIFTINVILAGIELMYLIRKNKLKQIPK